MAAQVQPVGPTPLIVISQILGVKKDSPLFSTAVCWSMGAALLE
jgi:hypothetical protein